MAAITGLATPAILQACFGACPRGEECGRGTKGEGCEEGENDEAGKDGPVDMDVLGHGKRRG